MQRVRIPTELPFLHTTPLVVGWLDFISALFNGMHVVCISKAVFLHKDAGNLAKFVVVVVERVEEGNLDKVDWGNTVM